MRRLSWLGVSLVLLVAAPVVGCGAPPGDDGGAGVDTGILVQFSVSAGIVGIIRVDSVVTGSAGTNSVTLPENFNPSIPISLPATYYILIDGAPQANTIGVQSISDPGPMYSIMISGFDNTGTPLGTVTTTVNVFSGQQESVTLTLSP